jgi:two-component system cell cycle sensor histidine kinase/response regulator CckA
VIEAECGSKALALWEQQSSHIDLVFTDVIMPGGMSGRDLADRLRQKSPQVKIVFTSGYSPSRAGRKQDILQGLTFLPKPYTPNKLLEAIQHGLLGKC